MKINRQRSQIIDDTQPDILFIAGYWVSVQRKHKELGQVFEDSLRKVLISYSKSARWVIVMGQCPRLDVPEESRYSIRRYYWSNYLQSDFDQVIINEDGSAERANAIVESVVNGLNLNNVIYEDPRHAFYQNGQFSPTRYGRFLYSDQHHINDYSARIIIKNIWERHAGKLTKTK